MMNESTFRSRFQNFWSRLAPLVTSLTRDISYPSLYYARSIPGCLSPPPPLNCGLPGRERLVSGVPGASRPFPPFPPGLPACQDWWRFRNVGDTRVYRFFFFAFTGAVSGGVALLGCCYFFYSPWELSSSFSSFSASFS